jgi:hypothetical protein
MTLQPRTRRRQVTAAASGILAVTLFLTGCASSEIDSTMDHTESAHELNELFVSVQDAIGGEWENADSAAEACELPSGGTGARAALGRFGQGVPVEQQQSVVDSITAEWSDAGFDPTITTGVDGDVDFLRVAYPESGQGPDGMYVELKFNENGSSILGQTRCVPGDYEQIRDEIRSSRTATPSPTPSPLP